MLRHLSLRDFVLFDHLELEIASGFGVLTGETGAGKSIFVDALGLLLGARADAALVRSGCERADIAALFEIAPDAPAACWCREAEISLEEDSLLLRRVIDSNGRSRAWVNAVAVTLQQLRSLGELLADIHGQHAHHALLKTDRQRQLLDLFAGAEQAARQTAEAFYRWRTARDKLLAVRHGAAERRQQRELLQWQVDEWAALQFEAGQWPEIEAEHHRLAHAAGLIEGVALLQQTLDEGEAAAQTQLRSACGQIEALVQIDPGLAEIAALLDSAAIQLQEAVQGLRRYGERLDSDPQRLADVEQKIGRVVDLARKHRVLPAALPELAAQWRETLATLDEADDEQGLQAAEESAFAAFEVAAKQLTALRREGAQKLSTQVSAAMQTLAMEGGRFEVELKSLDEPAAHGNEEIGFLVSANAGQPLRALGKVASGGELSRIGLAIQVLTSHDSDVATLIFDEVDVGIGGGVAEIVGHRLADIGRERQVLCVTHLPQVAARADWQAHISKKEEQGQTLSTLTRLDHAARVEEIARMLGGVRLTETTRKHAAEMIAGSGGRDLL